MQMALITLLVLAFSSAAAALSLPSWAAAKVQPLAAALNSVFPRGTPRTPEILTAFEQPTIVDIARNSYVYRQGSTLRLLGDHWTASGANVYWLGLDENIISPPGKPFFAPFNASYPTLSRITEVMRTLVTMGAKVIRSQTNELSGPVFGYLQVLTAWTQEIAQYVKSIGPNKLVMDGTYGINSSHLSIPEVDIYSDHFYPVSIAKLQDDIALVGSAKKCIGLGSMTGLD